ncbi:putative N-acetyltransferase YycN [compost metagenome]
MSEQDYAFWSKRSRESYADDMIKANGLKREEADKTANDSFKRLLPDGRNSKDNFLFTAHDEAQNVLGYIWFTIRGAENNRKAFICDVVIQDQYRGKGYGTKIMELVEIEIKKQGLNRIGLHVFGFNETAINLYKKLGYLTTDLEMEKTL